MSSEEKEKMYAVIQTGGKQYRVSPGDYLEVERLEGQEGDLVEFQSVLLASDGQEVRVGRPFLEGTKVIGRILKQGKGKKIVVFKYKRRKNYRRKKGHRQLLSFVRIEKIEA